jgi:hypothetical protein
VADEYLVDEIAEKMAKIEKVYLAPYFDDLDEGVTLRTFAGLPDDGRTTEYPFICGVWDRSDFDPYRGKPHGDTMGGESAIDEQVHYYDRWAIVGDRHSDLKDLQAMARRFPNLMRRCYLANIALDGKCSTAVPVSAVNDVFRLLGTRHYGVRFSVKVELNARVVVSRGTPP